MQSSMRNSPQSEPDPGETSSRIPAEYPDQAKDAEFLRQFAQLDAALHGPAEPATGRPGRPDGRA
jgi:hypothetical protein